MKNSHDISVKQMIDADDDEEIGLLGRDAEIQFIRLAQAYNNKKETIAGLETEIFRLQGIIGQFSGLHEALMQNIEGYDKHLVEAIKKYIPRKDNAATPSDNIPAADNP